MKTDIKNIYRYRAYLQMQKMAYLVILLKYVQSKITIARVKTTVEPNQTILINEEGYPVADTTIKYKIEPLEYKYLYQDLNVDIYEKDKDGNETWMGLVQADTDGNIVLSQGSAKFNSENSYYAQLVLNRGTKAEVRSEEVLLPIGQFRIVTDDADQLSVKGAVTDGVTRLRLQLFVKNNSDAFAGFTWNLIDPEVLDYTSSDIRGAFVDGDTLVDSMPVTFNANGVAEVIYRVPENFVRWGTSYETSDKDLAERVIQPTINLQNYLKTLKDSFSPIKLKRPPVILVHGLWGNGDKNSDKYVWKDFESKFNSNTLYDIFSVNYYEKDQQKSIAVHASKLRKRINAAVAELQNSGFAASKTDVIAHSMGGLLTREYCQQYSTDCQGKIRRFITIATPHSGSELADLLLVYRDDINNFPNPFPYVCRDVVDAFVNGMSILGTNIEPHPITPSGGAIDDLATGRLPDFINSTTNVGRWSNYPSIAGTFSSHTIIGLTTSALAGIDTQIWALWKLVLEPCGFTRNDVFGSEAEQNDRIVRASSQQGGVLDKYSTKVYDTDHFTVRNSDKTIEKIKTLLDEQAGSEYFTK